MRIGRELRTGSGVSGLGGAFIIAHGVSFRHVKSVALDWSME